MIRPCPKPEKRDKKPRAQLRRTWLRARRFTKQQLREGDLERVEWVRTQPCCMCDAPPRSHCCHEGRTLRGTGRKCHDDETIPLCWRCHRYWTGTVGNQGPFEGWSKQRKRDWADDQIAATTGRYLSHGRHRG